MAGKVFYDCGCMEQGDEFFHCAEHKPGGPLMAPVIPPPPLSEPELEELERLATAATPGPWVHRSTRTEDFIFAGPIPIGSFRMASGELNARATVAFRNALPALLQMAEQQTWRPVSNGVRDGESMLAYWPAVSRSAVFEVEWRAGLGRWGAAGLPVDVLLTTQPTHLMPLPVPPASSSPAREGAPTT